MLLLLLFSGLFLASLLFFLLHFCPMLEPCMSSHIKWSWVILQVLGSFCLGFKVPAMSSSFLCIGISCKRTEDKKDRLSDSISTSQVRTVPTLKAWGVNV